MAVGTWYTTLAAHVGTWYSTLVAVGTCIPSNTDGTHLHSKLVAVGTWYHTLAAHGTSYSTLVAVGTCIPSYRRMTHDACIGRASQSPRQNRAPFDG